MGNISDYLAWRGDIPFSKDPFNEVDNLILSEMVYTDLEGIVSAGGAWPVSIGHAAREFFKRNKEEDVLKQFSSTKHAPFVLRQASETARFSELKLVFYCNEIDEETQMQFAAVVFLLPDGTDYVAFRGTDNTIVGWKEDFNMSFLYQTPGQMRSVSYLKEYAEQSGRPLRLGGHSKGGNLAMYAAVFSEEGIRNRILEIWANDSPGFRREILETTEFVSMLPRIRSIVPEMSWASMIFKNDMPKKVIRSSETGTSQHDPMSWEILGKHFVEAEALSRESELFYDTFRDWLKDLSNEERADFFEAFFEAMQSDGVETIDDLMNDRTKTLLTFFKTYGNLDRDKQKMFSDGLTRIFAGVGIRRKERMGEKIQEFLRNQEKKRENGSIHTQTN